MNVMCNAFTLFFCIIYKSIFYNLYNYLTILIIYYYNINTKLYSFRLRCSFNSIFSYSDTDIVFLFYRAAEETENYCFQVYFDTMNIERTEIAVVNEVLSNMNSETTEDTIKTNAEKNDLASVKLDDGPTENAIEEKNDFETKEQESEIIVLGGSANETGTSITSNLITETCEGNIKTENNILKCPETNKSECVKISEILQTNENNIIEADCEKMQRSSSEEKKEKMKSFKTGKVVFATLKPKAKKNDSNLIYYAGKYILLLKSSKN